MPSSFAAHHAQPLPYHRFSSMRTPQTEEGLSFEVVLPLSTFYRKFVHAMEQINSLPRALSENNNEYS